MHQTKTGCVPVDGESDSMLNSAIARRVAPKRAVNQEGHNPTSNSTKINNMAANSADVGKEMKEGIGKIVGYCIYCFNICQSRQSS